LGAAVGWGVDVALAVEDEAEGEATGVVPCLGASLTKALAPS
jgi:hypothetical protein